MGKVDGQEGEENSMNNEKKKSTIDERKSEHKKAILEHLAKIPIVHIACERAGVSRATYYRWIKEGVKFKRETTDAIKAGEALINDMGESQLINLIKEKNFSAVRYWLDRRHPKFKRPQDPEDSDEDHKVTYKIMKYQ